MKTTELINDPQGSREAFYNGRQAMLWTALPGIVQSFDAKAMTCEVQPAIQGKAVTENGTVKVVTLPLLLDCPVVFPHAGGCSITVPIKPGDECLVIFSARAIDFWWQSGGVQPPAETRMHDLSDGFVIPGAYSQPNVISDVSTECLEIRSDDRKAFLSIHPLTHDVTLETARKVTAKVGETLTAEVGGNTRLKCPKLVVDCPDSSFTGTVTVDGVITGKGGLSVSGGNGAAVTGNLTTTGDVKAGSISLQGHVHPCGDHDTGAPK